MQKMFDTRSVRHEAVQCAASASCGRGETAMTAFVFGLIGALCLICSALAIAVLAVAETADKRAGRVASPADEEWAKRVKIGLRVAFWGGLLVTWLSVMASPPGYKSVS